jgi:hypothetical protein
MINLWTSITHALPPENVPVHTKIDDEQGLRNETILIRSGNLWFMEDRTMYVYYQPTHWRNI